MYFQSDQLKIIDKIGRLGIIDNYCLWIFSYKKLKHEVRLIIKTATWNGSSTRALSLRKHSEKRAL